GAAGHTGLFRGSSGAHVACLSRPERVALYRRRPRRAALPVVRREEGNALGCPAPTGGRDRVAIHQLLRQDGARLAASSFRRLCCGRNSSRVLDCGLPPGDMPSPAATYAAAHIEASLQYRRNPASFAQIFGGEFVIRWTESDGC